MGKKDAQAEVDKKVYGDLSSDDDEPAAKTKGKISGKKPPSKGGVKWSIVFLLSLFVLPGVFGALSYLYDLFYPQAAIENRIRTKLVKCYTVADPDKLSKIDHLMKKYDGREHALFAQLKEKYRKIPECQ